MEIHWYGFQELRYMDLLEAEKEYTDEVIGSNTIPEMIEESFERNSENPAQMYKGGVYDRSLPETAVPSAPVGEFSTLTYEEMEEIVHALAAGFRELGVTHGERVAIHSNTRMEWAQTDFALLACGAVVTTVYTSSSPRQVEYLLDDPGAVGVVTENEELLDRVLEVEEDLDLGFIVSIDSLNRHGDRDDVYELGDVLELGREEFDKDSYQGWLRETDPGDLASLIYTSGTTGRPKGVKLTHRNFRSNVNQVRKRFGPRPDKPEGTPVIDTDTRTVSYLPLAHVFERLSGHFLIFASGATVGYAESPDTLREDFQKIEPTSATSVPRVYEKMYEAVEEEAEKSGLKERIFNWATEVGQQYFESDEPGTILSLKHSLADKLVFSNVREALGGEVEILISGGGSLSPDLCKLYHSMGLPIYEGYGLTETSPVVSSNPPEAVEIGTLGPPVVDLDIRIDTAVRMESSVDGVEGEVGELLVRGPNVTDGYWNQPEETAASFTEAPAEMDGGSVSDEGSGNWFRTGDIIEVLPDGYLKFHERAKQIIVLSTGKNVAPQPIENEFVTSDLVEQIMVLGDDRKFISALVIPNFKGLRRRAEKEGVDLPEDEEGVCGEEVVEAWIQEEVDEVNKNFESYETIKKFRLVPEEFTEENGLLTPTMKLKRRTILESYEDVVESMYSED